MGGGGLDTLNNIKLAHQFGANAVLAVTPPYTKPPQVSYLLTQPMPNLLSYIGVVIVKFDLSIHCPNSLYHSTQTGFLKLSFVV